MNVSSAGLNSTTVNFPTATTVASTTSVAQANQPQTIPFASPATQLSSDSTITKLELLNQIQTQLNTLKTQISNLIQVKEQQAGVSGTTTNNAAGTPAGNTNISANGHTIWTNPVNGAKIDLTEAAAEPLSPGYLASTASAGTTSANGNNVWVNPVTGASIDIGNLVANSSTSGTTSGINSGSIPIASTTSGNNANSTNSNVWVNPVTGASIDIGQLLANSSTSGTASGTNTTSTSTSGNGDQIWTNPITGKSIDITKTVADPSASGSTSGTNSSASTNNSKQQASSTNAQANTTPQAPPTLLQLQNALVQQGSLSVNPATLDPTKILNSNNNQQGSQQSTPQTNFVNNQNGSYTYETQNDSTNLDNGASYNIKINQNAPGSPTQQTTTLHQRQMSGVDNSTLADSTLNLSTGKDSTTIGLSGTLTSIQNGKYQTSNLNFANTTIPNFPDDNKLQNYEFQGMGMETDPDGQQYKLLSYSLAQGQTYTQKLLVGPNGDNPILKSETITIQNGGNTTTSTRNYDDRGMVGNSTVTIGQGNSKLYLGYNADDQGNLQLQNVSASTPGMSQPTNLITNAPSLNIPNGYLPNSNS